MVEQLQGDVRNFKCSFRSCVGEDVFETKNTHPFPPGGGGAKNITVPVVCSSLEYVHIDQRDAMLSELYSAVSGNKGRCVLLEGESGCGKTKILRVLANMCNKGEDDLVVIHIGEQLDSKVLIGTFTCSGVPGEFLWVPGILTQSVLAGKWVFLEDIDYAPSDILALLLPLIKERKLVLPGYTNPVFASETFRLFATRRLGSHGVRPLVQNMALLNILENHMNKFTIAQYTDEDKKLIISTIFPHITPLIPSVIHSNPVGLRKLHKLGHRLCNSVHNGRIIDTDEAMLEILDVLGGEQPQEERLNIAMRLRSIFGGMSTEKVEYLCTQYKPFLQVAKTSFTLGRAYLERLQESGYNNQFYAYARSSLVLLEKVGRCVQLNEPVLLVGETGVGKTAAVSHLATMTGNKLVTINLSQQTDSTDLLGGFKPVQLSQILSPLRKTFDELFAKTFDLKKTSQFLSNVQAVVVEKNWKKLLEVFIQSVKVARKKMKGEMDILNEWKDFEQQTKKIRKQLELPQAGLAFQFQEGALVEAVRKGWWVLLDEVNLASPEALQCLNSLLEGPQGSFILTEKLDSRPIRRHPDFRLFCCMNPVTDIGKKSLPPSLRDRFTEFYVDELKDNSDLRTLVTRYLSESNIPPLTINGVIKFYRSVRELAKQKLQDGTGRQPHYSLRTLCRSLAFAAGNPCKNILRSLYEGFLMNFLTQLKSDHHVLVSDLAKKSLGIRDDVIGPLPRPKEADIVQVEGFWLDTGTESPKAPTGYVTTSTVRSNLKNLARIVYGRKLPVLLQGPTSAGKTSLIQYLACLTGHKCLRINNHEHTDLQEYIGMYSTGTDGQLVFQEGVLVEAMRNGYWVILDELNLAPTDVLEALNRVLDDNRELFIPETQELIKAHPHFMLFGTQNPPGVYGGRKALSRAFRNRFVELHFEDIPSSELVHILNQCSALPVAYAKKMVAVMKNLQQRRSASGVFEGKYGLITLRDLFRWAERYHKSLVTEKFYDWEQQLAEDGFLLLSGRLRNSEEIIVIQEVIEKHFKRKIDQSSLFGWGGSKGGVSTVESIAMLRGPLPEEFEHIVWTPELMRMGVLVHRAVMFQEPVLLVGKTGCGKTTLCQLLMKFLRQKLYIMNCHMHTEAADFLGGLRPVRNRSEDNEENDPWALFEWCDGILVQAMREGECVLLDEISLAEDAVLERLNSVLEPERKLLVAERGKHKEQVYELVAKEGFLLLATMNPGGDYGKKELSPALRNRFVEIWCQDVSTTTGYRMIIDHNLKIEIKDMFPWSERMLDFLGCLQKLLVPNRAMFTTRDILMWVSFINKVVPFLSPPIGYLHGAEAVFVDALGCGGCNVTEREAAQSKCKDFLRGFTSEAMEYEIKGVEIREDSFGIHPFYVKRGPMESSVSHYCLSAEGPLRNAFRLLRAMQLGRPLILEGDPGVGKTSLVSALAAAGGHCLTRINLSEHTDVSDLFGSDLPTEGEGEQKVRFAWRDGPFLKALKNSEWILLDEMNLASQSVLEGLNACLDHRGEIFIPELNKVFTVPGGTRLFACQNPHCDGGGRKGLPKSFVNRFIQVYMEPMSCDDLVFITCSLYPELDLEMVKKMVDFNSKVRDLVHYHGDQWAACEFNLRDVLRWCELIKNGGGNLVGSDFNPGEWLNLLYLYRIRNLTLRTKVLSVFFEVFGWNECHSPSPLGQNFTVSDHSVQIGSTCLTRGYYRHGDTHSTGVLLPCQLPLLEAMLQSVSMNWMTVLVGGSCSGKSQLVHSLACLTGHKLLEYPMNTATDTMELLGGFEQVNVQRHFCNLVCKILDVAECLVTEVMTNGGGEEGEQLVETIELLNKFSLPKIVQSDEHNNGLVNQMTETKRITEDILALANKMESRHAADLLSLLPVIDELLHNVGVARSGQFEWVDSLLVQAIKEGYWMLLSHANFCSPSVLDRLNPLFEPNPVLSIDERGVVEGSVPIVTPHPNFRLFLTLDPSNGEISRALRNRGVEIAILDEDVQDLCNSLTSSSFPSIRDLSLTPVATLVNREVQPLSDLVQCYKDYVEPSIEDLLKLNSTLEIFIDRATVEDFRIRGVVLKHLSSQGFKNNLVEAILFAGVALLEDEMFIEMANGIRELLQEEFGCQYDGPIDFGLNERVCRIVSAFPTADLCFRKLESFTSYSTIKRIELFHRFLLTNKTNWSQPGPTSPVTPENLRYVLPVRVAVRLTAFVGSLLSALLQSISEGIQLVNRARSFDVLFVFILCYMSSSELSLLAMAWTFLKRHCLETFFPVLSCRESLCTQLDSLSELDSLVSLDVKVLNQLRKLLGGPSPPTSLDEIQLLSVIETCDMHIRNSSSLTPPLYLFTQPAVERRRQLLLQQTTPTLDASLGTIEPENPPVLSCITQPALYQIRQVFYGSRKDPSLAEYCLHVPYWPMTSLKSLNMNYSFLPLLELSYSDPHLQSLTSFLSSVHHADHPSPSLSLMGLCHSSLLSPQRGRSLLTLGNYKEKILGLDHLLNFLWVQGFSPVQDSRSINSQDTRVLKHSVHTILDALECIVSTDNEIQFNERMSSCDYEWKMATTLSSLSEDRSNGQRWISVQEHFLTVLSLLNEGSRQGELELGMAEVHLGVALCALFSPMFLLDPLKVKRAEIELLKILEQYNEYLVESHTSQMAYVTCTSWKMLYPSPTSSSFYKIISKKKEHWTSLKQQEEEPTADRLLPEKFSELATCGQDILTNLCQYDKIISLIREGKAAVWEQSVLTAMHQLRERFPTYPDLVQPFTASLAVLLHGVRSVSQQNLSHQDGTLACIPSLVKYPYLTKGDLCYGALARIQCILGCVDEELTSKKRWSLLKRLLMICIEIASSFLLLTHKFSPVFGSIVDEILARCYQVWKIAEDKRKEREKEEESLYRYKPKVVDINETEEEDGGDAALHNAFPNYEKEFETTQTTNPVDQAMNPPSFKEDSSYDQFEIQEMVTVTQLHWNWVSPPTGQVGVTKPSGVFLHMYNTGGDLINEEEEIVYRAGLSDIGGHIRACVDIMETSRDNSEHSKSFNIYKDPNISETKRAQPVIQELVKQVQQVMEEWPDYPVLVQVLSACNAVLSLSVSEPLMKVLTGLEMVLCKAQEWESYSCSRLSLSKPLSSLSSLVLEWRKMELSYWGNLLEICKNDFESQASQWWFHLYGLCLEGVSEEGGVTTFVKALQQLMETSMVGDFSVRLNLLNTFSTHFSRDSLTSSRDRAVGIILSNIYHYYQQFLPAVQSHLIEVAAPAEKEFKEHLSIMRWNDGNYWAIKQASEKSHRTLLHFMKKYKGILNQPVRPVLTTGSVKGHEPENQESHLVQLLSTLKEQYGNEMQPKEIAFDHTSPLNISLSGGVSLTMSECHNRMSVLCSRFVSHATYPECCIEVDQFITEVITSYHELQRNDSLPSGGDEKKRVSAIKLLLMRRKRALSDLVKKLKQYGLSHRKGEELQDDLQLLPFTQPFPPATATDFNYNHYFYLSLARMVALVTAVASPSKDLSLYHVSCIKGFSRQLVKWLCQERSYLGDGLAKATQLDHMITKMEMLLEDELCSVRPQEFRKWQDELSSCLSSCLEAISDTHQLLAMLPASVDLSLTLTPTDQLPPLLTGGREWVSDINTNNPLTKWKDRVSNFMENVLKSVTDVNHFVSRKELLILQEGYRMLEDLSGLDIPKFLQAALGNSGLGSPGLFEYLIKLKDGLSRVCSRFHQWVDEASDAPPHSTVCFSSLTSSSEQLVISIMLGTQRVMEREKEMKRAKIDGQDYPLLSNMFEATLSNTRDVNVESANLHLCKLLDNIGVIIPPSHTLAPLLSTVIPFLKVYQNLVHRTMDELKVCHRTLGKMTSVIMEIFTNLCDKGFCTPPEYSNEEGMEGSEFVDIEAGGFDEGEGSKNVNDKIDQDNLDPGGDDGGKEGDKEKREKAEEEKGDNAFEVDEEFEGRMEDLEDQERDKESCESDDESNQEIEKRMGEVDGKEKDNGGEELDRNMWAPEEEAEEEEREMNKESGGGTSLNEETQLVAKEDSKRKQGDPLDDKETAEEHPMSEDDELVNDIDEYFEAGRESKKNEQEMEQENEATDFGELNLEEEEIAEENNDLQDRDEQGAEEEGAVSDIEEEMDVTNDPPSPSGPDQEEIEQEEQGGGDGYTQEMEDMEEDVDMESRSYSNSDAVYGVPQTQSTEADDKQKSNSEVKDAVSDQSKESTEKPNSDSGTVTNAAEENNGGSIVPAASSGKVKNNHSRRKHSKDDYTPNPISEPIERPIKRARLLEATPEEGEGNPQSNAEQPQPKDSDQYQHVNENQPSDNLAWDTVTGPIGGGKNPIGEHPQNQDEEESEEEGNNMATNEEVSMAEEYQLSDAQGDGCVDVTEEKEMEMEESEEKKEGRIVEEKERQTNSFFSNVDPSVWVSGSSLDESSVRECLMDAVKVLQQGPLSEDSAHLWMQYETLTSTLSHALCEELRLILQPTQASKLKGDFRSGKRLNMRRIIPYIASNFQNDRIWLRRCKPSNRQYQILLAVDDSSSMKENNCNQMAYESLAVISSALQKLECGQLGICRFGEGVEVLHPLESPFSANQGGHLLCNLTFTQKKTNFVQLLKSAKKMFGKCLLQGNKASVDISQLLVVLSDGRGVFADGTQAVEYGVRKLTEMGVFIVFIILDGLDSKDSIVDIKVPIFASGQPPIIKSYLETFPFPFYIVLRDIQKLPVVLGESLRQWFEMVTMNS